MAASARCAASTCGSTKASWVCLIGANGAARAPRCAPSADCALAGGEVVYGGKSIGGQKSHELVRQGLVMVPEGRGIFGQLTIEENLAMGGTCAATAQIRQDTDRVFTLFPRRPSAASRRPAPCPAASSRVAMAAR